MRLPPRRHHLLYDQRGKSSAQWRDADPAHARRSQRLACCDTFRLYGLYQGPGLEEWFNGFRRLRALPARPGMIEDGWSVPSGIAAAGGMSGERPAFGLGSARVSRAGFGVSPKRSFDWPALSRKSWRNGKVRDRETRSPARETHALPRAWNSLLGRPAVVDFNNADAGAVVYSREQSGVGARRKRRRYARFEAVGGCQARGS